MAPIRLRVRELREAQGLSQAELAKLAAVRQGTISKIERGQTTGVDFAVLERIADALHINAAALIAHEPKASRSR
jgi:transcriptional regulator with XRE-family HTH domain